MQEQEPEIIAHSNQRTKLPLCFVIMPMGGTTKEHDKKYWEFFFDYVIAWAFEGSSIRRSKDSESYYTCVQPQAGRDNI